MVVPGGRLDDAASPIIVRLYLWSAPYLATIATSMGLWPHAASLLEAPRFRLYSCRTIPGYPIVGRAILSNTLAELVLVSARLRRSRIVMRREFESCLLPSRAHSRPVA